MSEKGRTKALVFAGSRYRCFGVSTETIAMRHSCLTFVCLSLICFFTACNKANISPDETPLVQKVVAANRDSIATYEFIYDTTHQLQSIKFENNNGHRWNISISSALNDSAIATTLYRQPNGIEVVSTDTLVYSNGKVIKKLNSYSSNIYIYDNLGRLIADSTGAWASRNEHTIAHDFVYNEHDNVILSHTYYYNGATIVINETMNASYTSTQNPYYKTGQLLYILYQSDLCLSRHNWNTVTYQNTNYPDHTEQYSYDYNSGFLTRMTIQRQCSNAFTYYFYY